MYKVEYAAVMAISSVGSTVRSVVPYREHVYTSKGNYRYSKTKCKNYKDLILKIRDTIII
ncbi:hypothetical protein D3C85_1449780 [compost metagenome]